MVLNKLFKHWSFRIFAPGTIMREKYEAFKTLLRFDARCHEQMAEFQDLFHGEHREDLSRIRKRFALFSDQVAGMVTSLEVMAPAAYVSLKDYHKKFDFYVRFLLAPPEIDFAPPFVLPLGAITPAHKNVGNKASKLAVLENDLAAPVPHGFSVTANAYHYLIEYNNLRGEIDALLSELNISSTHSLQWISGQLTERIRAAEVPPDIEQAMLASFEELERAANKQVVVAVRSSAISEDGECSFAGQYTTRLEVTKENLIAAYLEVLSSKYLPEALFYRISHGLGDEETAMSVLVVEMVPARCSGVLYTRAPLEGTQDDDKLHLHVVRGQGEALVGGTTIPDRYLLTKEKPCRVVSREAAQPIITEEQAEVLGTWAIDIEKYFNTPQDIEWSINHEGDLYFLQTRPLHISEAKESPVNAAADLEDSVVLQHDCERAAGGVAAGPVYLLDENHLLNDVPAGAVLVSRDTPPGYVQVISRLAGVIAERGSRASHFATVAREFGVPFLAGVTNARQVFAHDSLVTVDGDQGVVYQGKIQSLLGRETHSSKEGPYHRILREVLKFIAPLELVDPAGKNFIPEGCRSMHDIIRFCHEKAIQAMFSAGRPGSGRGSLRLVTDTLPLDVFLFDVGGGIAAEAKESDSIPLAKITSVPFHSLWRGLAHPDVQWKQKPFDWNAFDKIELAGGVPPARDSFAFASYAVIGSDYLHFNIRFGYHFTIVDVLCGENDTENYCMLRFAGGGGDFGQRSLRIDFISRILEQLEFLVEEKGDMLEARLAGLPSTILVEKLDMLGRLLGATKLMDMVLEDEQMVTKSVAEFFAGRYSFSQEG